MVKSLGALLLAAQLASAGPIRDLLHTIDIGDLKGVVWPKDRPHPVHLTTTPSGQKLAWVRRDAQPGGSAKAPKIHKSHLDKVEKRLHPELTMPGVERGPAGTVPFQVLTKEEYMKIPPKQPSPFFSGKNKKAVSKRQDNPHYYGNTGQTIDNYGGSCVLSLFEPTIQGDSSESLIQVAIENGSGGGGAGQTAEAGWQVEPAINNGDTAPHVFVYFTTDGYQGTGDYIGGYNTFQAGWVQTDANQYPGFTFSEFSTVGGPQYDTPLGWARHDDGNWWLTVNGVTMGYLNGTMYNGGLGDISTSLQFYGEVADASAPPTSQMGSGQFAETGAGNSAYINNMEVLTDMSGTTQPYNGGEGQATDASCYTADTFPDNTDSRGSYMFVGGPGCPT